MPAPQTKIGDVVEYTSFLEEPRDSGAPWFAPASGPLIPAPPRYRRTCAIVVGVNGDQTVDLQVFHRSAQGVQFVRRVPYNSNSQTPNTWRSRP